jgi:hypothetical protein
VIRYAGDIESVPDPDDALGRLVPKEVFIKKPAEIHGPAKKAGVS